MVVSQHRHAVMVGCIGFGINIRVVHGGAFQHSITERRLQLSSTLCVSADSLCRPTNFVERTFDIIYLVSKHRHVREDIDQNA